MPLLQVFLYSLRVPGFWLAIAAILLLMVICIYALILDQITKELNAPPGDALASIQRIRDIARDKNLLLLVVGGVFFFLMVGLIRF